ncbi:MAG: polyprenyl synthetase family protein [bacterium]
MIEQWASLSKDWIHKQIEEIYEPVQSELNDTEQIIQSFFDDEPRELIRSASQYLAGAGGKRIRPALVLLFAKASGNITNSYDHPRAAASVEYIHNATLIHDDVVDEAELRRGVRSVNEKWDNKTAVLIGDYLYSRALDEITQLGNWEIVAELTKATRSMSRGELISLNDQIDVDISREKYFEIIEHKTASLMSAACFAGAAGDEQKQGAARVYGENFGLAFQIFDDIIDLLSESDTAGKNAFKDLEKGKLTLPLIEAISVNQNGARARIEGVLDNTSTLAERRNELLPIIKENNGFKRSAEVAAQYAEKAKDSIDVFPESPAKQSLQNMCDYVVNRNF